MSQEPYAGCAHVIAARVVAEAIDLGWTICELDGHPISQLQRVSQLAAVIQAFDGTQQKLLDDAEMHALLSGARKDSA